MLKIYKHLRHLVTYAAHFKLIKSQDGFLDVEEESADSQKKMP